jgi:hypothetical protein
LNEILEVSYAEVDFRRHLANEGNACITVATSKCFCNALTNLLLVRTPANIDREVADGADGHRVALSAYLSTRTDRGNEHTTLARLTERQGFRVAWVSKARLVTRCVVMTQ